MAHFTTYPNRQIWPKAIDFVLTLLQSELDFNIWVYPPIGFQEDVENESKQYHILKLKKQQLLLNLSATTKVLPLASMGDA